MSSGGSKEKDAAENTIKPLGKSGCLTVGGRRRCECCASVSIPMSVPLSTGPGRLQG
jgi:hypothetical protein